MKSIIKKVFAKRNIKKRPVGNISLFVEIENISELKELTKECCEAIEHLNNCIDKLNKFEIKVSTSLTDD
ncbi:hypothetical protein [Streptococcus sp. Marseille-P7375]|uniref:hypothetical protein n=1 Tax=Streptococcus sp. Marseille-P7375 TaxID=2487318 RepID=UPI0011E854FC|nr:hypothetical protein [Streptococcus sp. Marseille-P7375]